MLKFSKEIISIFNKCPPIEYDTCKNTVICMYHKIKIYKPFMYQCLLHDSVIQGFRNFSGFQSSFIIIFKIIINKIIPLDMAYSYSPNRSQKEESNLGYIASTRPAKAIHTRPLLLKMKKKKSDLVAPAFNSSTREVETGRSRGQGQFGLHKTLIQKMKK